MGCNFCWSVSVIVIVSIVYVGPLLIVKEKGVRRLEVYTFIRDDHLLRYKPTIFAEVCNFTKMRCCTGIF